MDWDDVFRIIAAAIAAVGGSAAIVVFTAKWLSERIAERLKAKYQLEMDKELEKFKGDIKLETEKELESFRGRTQKKNYVSRVRFDTEFEIFRRLNVAFAELNQSMYFLYPVEILFTPSPCSDAKKEYDNKAYDRACTAFNTAVNELNGNAAFISYDLYTKFRKILELCKRQLNDHTLVNGIETNNIPPDFCNDVCTRTEEIAKKYKDLISDIRIYLASLDVED